jgi:type II secretory pathway component PulJ
MKTTNVSFCDKPKFTGFVLMEIIMALGLFSIVAVSLTAALDQIARGSILLRQHIRMLRVLESSMAQATHRPKMKLGMMSFPNQEGVASQVMISELERQNQDGIDLQQLYRLHGEAWMVGNEGVRKALETYVYTTAAVEK